MNQNENNGSGSISWGRKMGYVGTGIVIGIVIYPFVKKTIAKVQPKLDKWLDDLTGKAEGFAERASDLVSTVRERFKSEESGSANGHDHDHGHGHAQHRRKASAKVMADKASELPKT